MMQAIRKQAQNRLALSAREESAEISLQAIMGIPCSSLDALRFHQFKADRLIEAQPIISWQHLRQESRSPSYRQWMRYPLHPILQKYHVKSI